MAPFPWISAAQGAGAARRAVWRKPDREESPVSEQSNASLRGRIAVIVGGAGPAGLAVARRFVREGALAVLADFDDTETMELAEQMTAEGYAAQGIGLDVTSPESVAAAFDLISLTYGLPTLLCYGVGFHLPERSPRAAPELWRQGVLSNLGGAGFCVAEFIERLAAQEGAQGQVVFLLTALGEEYTDPLTEVTRAGFLALARSSEVNDKSLRISAAVALSGPLPGSGAERTLRAIARMEGVEWERFLRHWKRRYEAELSTDPEALARAVAEFAQGRRGGGKENLLRIGG